MIDLPIPGSHFPMALKPQIELTSVRELTPQDGLIISAGGCPTKQEVSTVQKLRDRHHWIARMVAQGNSEVEISAISGMSLERLRIFQADPAFLDLVAHYRSETKEYYLDMARRLSHLSGHAIEELQERLETNPEEFSIKDLMALSRDLLDRTGHGAQSKVQVSTVDVVGLLKELKIKNAAESATIIVPREGPHAESSGESA